jgi:hypothetical protein
VVWAQSGADNLSNGSAMTFQPSLIEAFPPDVLRLLGEHCILVEDEFNRVNYAFGHFKTKVDGDDFLFEICMDLNQEGRLEIYDLSHEGQPMAIDRFLRKLSESQPQVVEVVNCD